MGKKIDMNKHIIKKNREDLPSGVEVIDGYKIALEELFFVRNPQYKKDTPKVEEEYQKYIENVKIGSNYIYYPWRNKIVHLPEESIFFELRTARNKNLIPLLDQENFKDKTLGIIGLSVGSAIINYISYIGGPNALKLADYDHVEISNLNRMYATVLDLGRNKTQVAAERAWEVNPYADIQLYDQGIDEKNLKEFLLSKPKLDFFVDSMDSLSLKVKARLICKENKIPVFMATSNGDSVIIDVERFDLNQDYPIFHGRLGDVKPEDFEHITYKEWLTLATRIVGFETLTPKMKESIQMIGKTISSVPQLCTTVNLSGIALVFILRHISSRQDSVLSGRYIINLDDFFK